MRVGFTGTQQGMTDWQDYTFRWFIRYFQFSQFNHGDCIGADEWSHKSVRELKPGVKVWGFLPYNTIKRAYCDFDRVMVPDDYISRNHNIVDHSDLLIACPAQADEQQRSGTWATIRYARKKKIPIVIINPDGIINIESGGS